MKYYLLLLAGLLFFPLSGKDFILIEKGVCDFEITTPASASKVILFGAKDLADLSKRLAAKGVGPKVLPPGAKSGKKAIFLTTSSKDLSGKARKAAAKLQPEGFLLEAGEKQLTIYSPTNPGVLYGVYEILKKWGNIRFLVPGEDGIYYNPLSRLAVPEGIVTGNPHFRIRTQILGSAQVNSPLRETWSWLVRNNMQINGNTRSLPKSTMLLLDERNGSVRHGGHAFDALMTGAWITCSGQEARKKFVQLQKEHPEYFPIINKKRAFGRFAQYNPCVAAEGLDKRMSYHLGKWAEKYASTPDSFIIGNNDITSWCECAKCDTYDPVPRYRARIKVPNRYWDFVNRIAGPVLDKYPKANLWGWAYQNFNMAPDKVKPDPRLSIMLVYNRHCYRHKADDPACPVNKEIFRMMKDWRKFPNIMANWDQVEDALSIYYLPMGKYYADRIKLYKKMGFDGLFIGNYPPDGIYPKRHDKRDIHRRHTWKMNWLDLYTSSRLLWDSSLDYQALLEEAGSLYYGNGWKNGMKEYHLLREKAFLEAPGCFGWGHDGSEPTRLIRDPFLRAKLAALLQKALASVKNDKRSASHIKDDIFYFTTAYEKRHEAFEKKLNAYTIYTGNTPKLDGKLTEKVWHDCNIYSTFRPRSAASGKKPPLFSFRAFAGNDQNLYMALRWKKLEKGSRVKLFFPTGVSGKNLVLTLSENGKILAQESSPEVTLCQSSSSLDKEGIRNTEIKIPAQALNGKLYPGSTFYTGIAFGKENAFFVPVSAGKSATDVLQVWRVNEVRATYHEGMERSLSSWSNGSLDEIRVRPLKLGKWEFPDKASPRSWGCVENTPGVLEMPLYPGENVNRYVKMQKGCLLAPYKEVAGKSSKGRKLYRLTVKCGGKGRAIFQAYWKDARGKSVETREIGRYKPAPDGKWQNIEFTFPQRKEGEWFHLFIRNPDAAPVLLDDIYIYPVKTLEGKEEK